MSLLLYGHAFSSYCQKAIVALYENETPFEFREVNLGDETSRNAFRAIWPMGKMPVLRDEARGVAVPEATIIIEYLDAHYPGAVRFLPPNPDLAWRARLRDRFYDLHVQDPMQRIVSDRLRPADAKDPTGVAAAHAALQTAYEWIEQDMAGKTWAMGDAFTLADCAAAPALFYADLVEPLGDAFPNTAGYLARLNARPSFARATAEAAYFMPHFPKP
ncbi:glutathione S-transferase family protein [Phenylobacterium sp.]|uniref:glutathione S-transferase family protein n=1 Tax=Phenylobacterium sp. TaxID=1871053 RepID=UPI00286ADC4F|nr:glutathione S-transferase family protein [Phenylobacterium sp.]